MQSVNDELHGNNDRSAGPSRRGHKEVCLLCGRSLAKLQSHLILSVTTSSRHNKTIQIVESRIAPRQVNINNSFIYCLLKLLFCSYLVYKYLLIITKQCLV